MFKKILIPTDGSPVAAKAVKAGIELAKEVGATVVAYYGLDPMPAPYYGDGYTVDARAIADIERSARVVRERNVCRPTHRAMPDVERIAAPHPFEPSVEDSKPHGWRVPQYAPHFGRKADHLIRQRPILASHTITTLLTATMLPHITPDLNPLIKRYVPTFFTKLCLIFLLYKHAIFFMFYWIRSSYPGLWAWSTCLWSWCSRIIFAAMFWFVCHYYFPY